MAMIKCPECKNKVSSAAKTCPVCGYPIARATSNKVQISIDQHPSVLGCRVVINHENGDFLMGVNAGSIATIETSTPLTIKLCGSFGGKFITTTVYPGKKYRATWGIGFLQPKIQSCDEIDIIDA